MPRKCAWQISCVNTWRCFCEQSNEPESKDPQHRKTEEYSGTGHSAELYVRALAGALSATAKHRGTAAQIADVPGILHNIGESSELYAMWDKYRKQFTYAAGIEYEQIIEILKTLVA